MLVRSHNSLNLHHANNVPSLSFRTSKNLTTVTSIYPYDYDELPKVKQEGVSKALLADEPGVRRGDEHPRSP